MSGRIRSIKPELLDDEPTAGLSDAAWRVFVSLWLVADDVGNARLGSRYVAATVWQDTSRDADAPLRELVEKRFLVPYAKSEQRYASIRGWEKHQRIDNASTRGRVPPRDEEDGSLSTWFRACRTFPAGIGADADRGQLRRGESGDEDPETPLARRAHAQSGGVEGNGGEGKGKEPVAETAPSPSTLPSEPKPPTDVERIFAYWLTVRSRTTRTAGRAPVLDKPRTSKIKARLADGYSPEDIMRGVDGVFADEWHREKHQTDIALVCRDGQHLDKFMALAPATSGIMATGAAVAVETTRVDLPVLSEDDVQFGRAKAKELEAILGAAAAEQRAFLSPWLAAADRGADVRRTPKSAGAAE